MFTIDKNYKTKQEMYNKILESANHMFFGIKNNITNLSNASALLNAYLKDINWVGFYLFENNELILGPFQGLPACTNIAIGKGVCGTTAKNLTTTVVPNVHEFPGHIACDSNSNSEIVLPIIKNNILFGVLDIDSPELNNFDDIDKLNLEKFISILVNNLV